MRAPLPGAAGALVGLDLADVASAAPPFDGDWVVEGGINVRAIHLDRVNKLGLRLPQGRRPYATLNVVELPAGLIDALRNATKKESYQLCRSALRSTRIEVSQRSSRSACGMYSA